MSKKHLMIKKSIGGLRRWLNFRQTVTATPIQDIETGTQYQWSATGIDSAFKLYPRTGPMPRGWYMLEITIRISLAKSYGKLYVDYGSGFDEENSFNIPLSSGKLIKKVVHFASIPKSIRFDPTEQKAELSIEDIRLHKLTSKRARQLMLKKLLTRGQKPVADINQLPVSSIELQPYYKQCFTPTRNSANYEQWIEKYETPLFSDSKRLIKAVEELAYQPKISVIMPVYNTPENYLQKAIESVTHQIYPNWELCIADDCSTDPKVRELLERYAFSDERIKVVYRERNGHISLASNSALEIATGKYIALLDHDDELAAHALYCIADAINQQPSVQLIYSDEDKIDGDGVRSEPHFKASWNRDLFYSHNYITHLTVIHTDLIKDARGFRAGFEGSQDYDLLLRCTAIVNEQNIMHIPHILYHWRAILGSTAFHSSEKNYTEKAGIKSLEDHFQVKGQKVRLEHGSVPNSYRIKWPIPNPLPMVSLLIPTRDGYKILKQCIESILKKTGYPNYEIIILDNQSSCNKTLTYFSKLLSHPKISILPYNQPFNYSAINNFGVAHAKGSIVGLINNDIEVISTDWLSEMVSHVCRTDIGCVGAKLYYPDGRIQHAGVVLGIGGVAGHVHKYFSGNHHGYFSRLQLVQNYSAVTAAALLVRKDLYTKVGGLNEKHLTVAFNDVDFCLKVQKAGFRNLWTPYAELYHHESVSRGLEDSPEKIKRFGSEIRFMKKSWGEQLISDPAYNPNLSLDHEDFSIID